MSLILIPCIYCKYIECTSEDAFWLGLEVQCENCMKFFNCRKAQKPLFISQKNKSSNNPARILN